MSENERDMIRLKNELSEIKKNVNEFEKASGVYLDRIETDHFWGDPKKMGEIFKLLNSAGGIDSLKKRLLDMEDTAKIIHEKISESLKSLNLIQSNEKE